MSEPNTAVARTGTAGLKTILAQPAFAKRFEEILGKRAPQFVASIISVASSLPQDTEPTTIVTSAMIAATLDLPINKELGFAWIVPYRNNKKNCMEAQFQMGHKGFIQLALRTGQYAGMNARAINAEALEGFDSIGEPIIKWENLDDTKETIGYAFAWKLVGGFTKVCYWPKKRVEAHAMKYSQAYRKGYESPWKSHFDGMALKTVIKNELSDWGILSVEMRQASKFDQAVVIDVDSEVLHYPDNNQIEDVPRAEATPGPKTAPFRRGERKTEPHPLAHEEEIAEAAAGLAPANQPPNVIPIEAKVEAQTPDPQPAAVASSASTAAERKAQTTQSTPSSTSATVASSANPAETTSPPANTKAGATSKTPFVLPPSKLAPGWIPIIDPLDPEGTKRSMMEILSTEEIRPEELLAWTEGRNLSKKGQVIGDLAIGKIIGLIKQREVWRAAILEARQ